jgi:hypothetical protein
MLAALRIARRQAHPHLSQMQDASREGGSVKRKKLYDALGVDERASHEKIKRAFRRRAKQTHPDHGGDRDEFALVVRAYRVLSDDEQRAEYDRTGREPQQRHSVETEATQMLVEQLIATLEIYGKAATYQDVLKCVRDHFETVVREITTKKQEKERKADFFKACAARVSRKDGGENVLAVALCARETELRDEATQGDKIIALAREAELQLDAYAWKTDVNPADMLSAWNMQLFASVTNRSGSTASSP